jgi:protein SCO1/2
MKKLFLFLFLGILGSQVAAQSLLSLSAGSQLNPPQPLPSFELIDMDGNPFTLGSVKRRWSFVFFGYRTCPDICPLTLTSLQALAERLGSRASIQFIFITIDPEKDTPSSLKTYFQETTFNRIKGVTGDKATILALAKAMSLHLDPVDLTEHSGTVSLINPKGELAAIFTSTQKPAMIAQDFKQIIGYRY